MKISLRLLTIAAVLLNFACAHKPPADEPAASKQKPHLVLINGYHLDETSWNDVVAALPADRYAITLMPRLGRDVKSPAHLDQVAQMVCERLPENSIVVAHSFGGAIANATFGACPLKVKKIIYVSALIPLDGERPFDQLAGTNQQGYMRLVTSKKGVTTPKNQKKFIAGMDAGVDVNSKTLAPVFPEAGLSAGDVVKYDKNEFEKIPKYYVFTKDDKIIDYSAQRKLSNRVKLVGTEIINSGHLPMLSRSGDLAKAIVKFAEQ